MKEEANIYITTLLITLTHLLFIRIATLNGNMKLQLWFSALNTTKIYSLIIANTLVLAMKIVSTLLNVWDQKN